MSLPSIRQLFSPRDAALFPLTVEAIHVRPGETVAAGADLLTLRTAAGKTLMMRTPLEGTVETIAASAGDMLASPRVLVGIAPAQPAAAADEPPAPPDDAPLASAEPETPAPAAPAARSRTRKLTIAALAAAGVIAGIFLLGEMPDETAPPDMQQAATAQAPAASAPPPSAPAAAQPADTPPRAAEAPPVQKGPLSRDVMQARSLDGRTAGRAAAPRLSGQGLLAVRRHGGTVECPALLVSDRHAITTRLCLDVRSTSDVTEEDSEITFVSVRPYAEGSIDSRSYFHSWQTGVTAVHVWHGEIEGGSPVSLAVVELADAAPKSLGRTGHWSMTSTSAPPLLDLRSYSVRQPLPGNAEAVACRYWLHEGAAAEVADNGMPLAIDPACAEAQPLVDGPFMARHENGTSYLAGFYSRTGRYKSEAIIALALSRGDEAVIASARNGTLLAGSVRLFPAQIQPPRPSHQVLVSNPCDAPARIVTISTSTRRGEKSRTVYRLDPGARATLPLELKPDEDALFFTDVTTRQAQGLVRHEFQDDVYYGLDFDATSPLQMLMVTECAAG